MSEYKPCPKCGAEGATKMSFTWWGGVIGPRILSHVKCGGCGKQFNGKSGGENTVGIIIYTIIVALVLGVILIAGLAVVAVVLTSS